MDRYNFTFTLSDGVNTPASLNLICYFLEQVECVSSQFSTREHSALQRWYHHKMFSFLPSAEKTVHTVRAGRERQLATFPQGALSSVHIRGQATRITLVSSSWWSHEASRPIPHALSYSGGSRSSEIEAELVPGRACPNLPTRTEHTCATSTRI